MRSLSAFCSFMGSVIRFALAQAVAERDTLVEYKTFAVPAARLFRYAFEVFEDAALEVIDLAEAAGEQIGAGLFASDAAGAEHRDLGMLRGVQAARGKFFELAEARDAG